MKLFSKELLLSGGKKQPEYLFQENNWLTIGEPVVGNNVFPSYGGVGHFLKNITGVLGQSNSSITIGSLSDSSYSLTCPFRYSFYEKNFLFYVYQGQRGFWTDDILVSPKQEIKDNVLVFLTNAKTYAIPVVKSISNGYMYLNLGATSDYKIAIQNTPVGDSLIYRA